MINRKILPNFFSRHARICPRGDPPPPHPGMATDKCITILGWTHLQHTCIAVAFAAGIFIGSRPKHNKKNSSGKMRQFNTYVENESTLIEENTERALIKFSEFCILNIF